LRRNPSGLIRSDSLGHTLQKWKPWLEPKYSGSAVWEQRNTISLSAAVEAFKFDKVTRVYTGVFHLGVRRTGSKTDSATSSHKHAHSIFVFSGDSSFPRRIGKILFMFRIKLSATVCEQDAKDPKCHIFAKVQVLDDYGLCPKSKLRVLRLNDANLTKIVLLKHIGAIAVIGAHPDPLLASQDQYLLLPWPRRDFTEDV